MKPVKIDITDIDRILDRFFEGATDSAEEKALEEFFSDPDVPERLEQFKPMFAWYAAGMPGDPEEAPAPARHRRGSIRPTVWWAGIAAALAVVLALGWNHHRNSMMHSRLLASYEGSYREVNGLITTDPDILMPEIKTSTMEARMLSQEIDAATREIQAEAAEEFSVINTQNLNL